MSPETFFQGRLTGWGVARDPFGQVIRRFTIDMWGEWSEEHRALHLDESYTYVGGQTYTRHWAIHTDEQGYIIGHDAVLMSRMKGRQIGVDFSVVFDRPRQPGSRRSEPAHRVRFFEVTADEFLMIGKVRRWGVMIATTQAALRRIS